MIKSKEATAQAPCPEKKNGAQQPKMHEDVSQEADFGAMLDDDDDDEEEAAQLPREPKRDSAPPSPSVPPTGGAGKTGPDSEAFEQSVVNGLFGDDDSDEESNSASRQRALPLPVLPKGKQPPANVPKNEPKKVRDQPPSSLQSQEPLVPQSLEAPLPTEVAVAVEDISPPPPNNKNLPGVPRNWTGKTPKKQLEEYMQKQKLGRPIFQKAQDNSCTLILKLPDGEKRFESVGEFLGHADVQHAAATRALYALLPNMPLYRLLPPPFRDWWQEWANEAKEKKEAEAAAFKKGKKERIQNLVQSIKTEHESLMAEEALPTTGGAAASSTGAGVDKPLVLPVLEGGTWEDLADHLDGQQDASQQGENSKLGDALKKRFERIKSSPRWREMSRIRASLPVAESRQEILDRIRREKVVVVSGETGCGKSTYIRLLLCDIRLSLLTQLRSHGFTLQVLRWLSIYWKRHWKEEKVIESILSAHNHGVWQLCHLQNVLLRRWVRRRRALRMDWWVIKFAWNHMRLLLPGSFSAPLGSF